MHANGENRLAQKKTCVHVVNIMTFEREQQEKERQEP